MSLSKRSYSVSDSDTVAAALKDVADGMSQREVAVKYNISRGNLQNKIKGSHSKKVGKPSVLSEVEDGAICSHIVSMGDWGFPFDRTDLRMVVKAYLDRQGTTVKHLN